MTDLNAANTALLPYILQPAVREPGFIEIIDCQVTLFESILSDAQMAAMQRALTTRNRPSQDVEHMVEVLDRLDCQARPGRDQPWHEDVSADCFEESGSLDDLYANCAAAIDEAQALKMCVSEGEPLSEHKSLVDHYSLLVFEEPVQGMYYYIGADCAEGLPLSHNSATIVVDDKGVEVANLVGKIHPTEHARFMLQQADWHNDADIMIENNWHGFAAISWLEKNGGGALLARGYNNKVGWTSNHPGKNTLYNKLDDLARTEDCTIRDREVYLELQSIDFRELRAPEGDFDDRADAYALAQAARGYAQEFRNIRVFALD